MVLKTPMMASKKPSSTTELPVLITAGPGTGKTFTLGAACCISDSGMRGSAGTNIYCNFYRESGKRTYYSYNKWILYLTTFSYADTRTGWHHGWPWRNNHIPDRRRSDKDWCPVCRTKRCLRKSKWQSCFKEISLRFPVTLKTFSLKENWMKNWLLQNLQTTSQHGAMEGRTQSNITKFYNLDVIISVGYRVKSQRGVQFRIWAQTS